VADATTNNAGEAAAACSAVQWARHGPMKMGTTPSRSRYDVGAYDTPP
jgi:hypothetical protein